jgi:class 3 adenylate cyclase
LRLRKPWARGATTFGWTACLASTSVVLLCGTIIITRQPNFTAVWPDAFDLLFGLAFLPLGATGALIIAGRRTTVVGWLFCAASVFWSLSLGARVYAAYPILARDLVSADSTIFAELAILVVAVSFFIFPEDRWTIDPRRPITPVVAVAVSVCALAAIIQPTLFQRVLQQLRNMLYPISLARPGALAYGAFALPADEFFVLVALCAAVVTVLVRLVWARGVRRQQLKWFACAAIVPLAGLTDMLLYDWGSGALIAAVGVCALAGSVAIAILRYRLYEIDFIVNRTLVYAGVVTVLGAVFVGITWLLQSVLVSMTGQRTDLVPGVAGVFVALTFQPVRSRAQTLVDRLLPEREERALFFTDIVGSTDLVARMGDARWRDLLDRYRATVRKALRRHGGTEMHIAGDSFFAVFVDPLRAVRCAETLVPVLRSLGLPSRFGIHWGTCEMRGEEVSGLSVWMAARVMSAAGQDEIVVSEALRNAVGQDTLEFQFRGRHSLKGIPGTWPLHALLEPAEAARTSTGATN